eukprot:6181105-Pleurochrysis_carterae.AAC.2
MSVRELEIAWTPRLRMRGRDSSCERIAGTKAEAREPRKNKAAAKDGSKEERHKETSQRRRAAEPRKKRGSSETRQQRRKTQGNILKEKSRGCKAAIRLYVEQRNTFATNIG